MLEDFSEMLEKSARGSMILMLGQMASTIISALGVIIVARILGSVNYGVLNVAIIPVNIALLFVNNGVSIALTNLIAEDRYKNGGKNIRSIIYSGFALNITVGILTTIILYLCSSYLAIGVYHQPELTGLIRILSITTISQALYGASISILIGYEHMDYHSFISILYSLLKSIIGPVLVYIGYEVTGAALGQTLPLLLSGVVAVALVAYTIRRTPPDGSLSYIKPIIRFSAPIFYASILGGLYLQSLNFSLSLHVGLSEMGNYNAAVNFGVLISFILNPISTAMFPLLSKLSPGDKIFQNVYSNIIKYEALAAYPIAAGVIALSGRMITILYGADYTTAQLYVKVIMLNIFFLAFGSTINGILLNSQKRTDINLRITLIHILVGLPMGIFLIPRYGVLGFQAATLLAPKFGVLYAIFWLRSNLGLRLELANTLRIGVSTLLGYISCVFVLGLFQSNPWIELVIGGVMLASVYLVCIIATGALNRKNIRDIKRLTEKNRLGARLSPILGFVERFAHK